MNNYEKIKRLTIEEMKKFLLDSFCCDVCVCEMDENSCMATGCEKGVKKWLMKEVEDEQKQ